MPSVEEELASRIARGEPVVLATVIKLDGEPPSQPGAKLLMSGTMSIAGTLGCSEFDSAALADSESVAAGGAPQMRSYRHDLGSIEVYLEPLRAKGVDESVIARIQSPVGLELGSRTPAEIALSILAGLVAVRRGGKGGWKQAPPAAGPPHSWGGGAKRRRG